MAALPALEYEAEATRICAWLEGQLLALRRRGLIVAVSGGIDSSVCLALAVRAVGADRVFALLLPERDSSRASVDLGMLVVEQFGVPHVVTPIAAALEAIGCYSSQDDAIRKALPSYVPGWKFKLAIRDAMGGRVSLTHIIAEDDAGLLHEARLGAREYLQLVAATNFKQRIRKTLEYYHADRLNYAVVGTPNYLEYDQGFFVKNGDGSADLKPIAHLFKTQVYELARHLGVPEPILNSTPSTDTFSLAQGQDEFYFGMPYRQMDIALWHLDQGLPASELAAALDISQDQASRVYENLRAKRRVSYYLHSRPLTVNDKPEI